MAARKSRHALEQTAEQVAAGDACVGEPASPFPGSASQPRLRSSLALRVACAVFLLWAAGLLTLAIVVESPIMLNRVQIRQADLVVLGQLDPTQEGVVLVKQSWPANATDAAIRIENLDQSSLRSEQLSLFPLSRAADGTFSIALTPPPTPSRLVYPATDDNVRAVEGILHADAE